MDTTNDRGVILWDFDGTLGRSGRWRDMLVSLLDRETPGHAFTPADFEPWLRSGFPWDDWHSGHPELCEPDAWWAALEPSMRRTLEGGGVPPDVAARVAAKVRHEYPRLERWDLYPDTLEALAEARRRGWRNAILSNHCPELPANVHGLGLDPYVELVLTSAATGFEKPHPEAFGLARRLMGNPDRIWMIGDNVEADARGAERCGIPAILVRRDEPGLRCAPDLLAALRLID